MKALIVGYGSIGARHARLLTEMGLDVSVASKRDVDFPTTYRSLAEAMSSERPDYIIVANVTSEHLDTVAALAQADYRGIVLVEKPIFSACADIPAAAFGKRGVAYNLRFHPLLTRLKSLLAGEVILSATAYVGQYLPEWRPAVDYRKSYSASHRLGGGVLNDISHELDYLAWLLGPINRVAAIGGKYSDLEIDSDDIFSLLMRSENCPAISLEMNYLDRAGRRFVIVNTLRHTIEIDFVASSIAVDKETESLKVERDESYRAMHQEAVSSASPNLCSFEEGLQTLKVIQAAEIAARDGKWVNL